MHGEESKGRLVHFQAARLSIKFPGSAEEIVGRQYAVTVELITKNDRH